MTANLVWQPIKPGKDLDCGAPSAVIQALEEAIGCFPCTLDEKDIRVLRAMSAASHDPTFGRLADHVEQHGAIRVWAER